MYPTKTSTRWNMPGAIVAFGILCAVLLLGEATQAQTFTVLHDFTGGAGGAFPKGNLAMDEGGNIYGTIETQTELFTNCRSDKAGSSTCCTPSKAALMELTRKREWSLGPMAGFTAQRGMEEARGAPLAAEPSSL